MKSSKSIYFLFIILALFVVLGFFFSNWMFGHRMDWSIPISSEALQTFFWDNVFKWREYNLGYQKIFYTNFLFIETFIWLLWFILSSKLTAIFVIFVSICFAGIGFFKFVKYFWQHFYNRDVSDFSACLAAWLYALSYAMFNQILWGNRGIAISAAFFPLFLLNFIKYLENGTIKYLFYSQIFLLPTISQVHYIIYIFFTILLFLFLWRFRFSFLKRFVVFSFIAFFFNAFWLIDFYSIVETAWGEVLNKVWDAGFLWWLKNGNNSMLHWLFFTWWGTNHLERPILFIYFLSVSFFLLFFFLLLIKKQNKKYNYVTYSILFVILLFFFLFTWFREPFFSLKDIVFNLPWATFFKSPQHNLMIISFFLFLLVTLWIDEIKNRKWRAILILFFLGYSYNFLPWNFIQNFNFYDQAFVITESEKFFKSDFRDYRLLFLPAALAPYIPNNIFDPKVWTDSDFLRFSKNIIFTEGLAQDDPRLMLEEKFYKESPLFSEDFQKLNIQYVILRNDRAHGNVPYLSKYWDRWDIGVMYDKLYKFLEKSPLFLLEKEWKRGEEKFSIWRVNTYTSLFETENLLRDSYFFKRSKVEYKINISIYKKTFIYFLQAFNVGRKFYLDKYEPLNCSIGWKRDIMLFDKWNMKKYPLGECYSEDKSSVIWWMYRLKENAIFDDSHQLVNGYANGRTLDADYIKRNFSKEYYKENPDGSIEVNLTLYFKPQSYFYVGLWVSGVTLLVLLFLFFREQYLLKLDKR